MVTGHLSVASWEFRPRVTAGSLPLLSILVILRLGSVPESSAAAVGTLVPPMWVRIGGGKLRPGREAMGSHSIPSKGMRPLG